MSPFPPEPFPALFVVVGPLTLTARISNCGLAPRQGLRMRTLVPLTRFVTEQVSVVLTLRSNLGGTKSVLTEVCRFLQANCVPFQIS
jgi:hypothetical protein